MRLWSDNLCMCFLVAGLASSIPLAPQSGPQIPPLPFPADEDISSCHFTPTEKSPTQPWHNGSFDPVDDNDNIAATLANQSLPLPLSSYPALAPASVSVTRKRDNSQPTVEFNTTTTDAICTTIAAFTFHNLPIYSPLGSRKTRPPLTLGPGSYVLSFTNDYRVRLIGVGALVDGHRSIIMHDVGNPLRGTVPFWLDQTAEVDFFFSWECTSGRRVGGGWPVGSWRCLELGLGREAVRR